MNENVSTENLGPGNKAQLSMQDAVENTSQYSVCIFYSPLVLISQYSFSNFCRDSIQILIFFSFGNFSVQCIDTGTQQFH